MNKSLLIASIVAVLALAACGKKEEAPAAPEPAAVAPVVEAASEAMTAAGEAASDAMTAAGEAASAAVEAVKN